MLRSITEGEDKPLKYPGLVPNLGRRGGDYEDGSQPFSCSFDRDLALKNINEKSAGDPRL